MIAILPCNDLDASERFYARLGFLRFDGEKPRTGEPETYRILSNGKGGYLHLTVAVEGWLIGAKSLRPLFAYRGRSTSSRQNSPRNSLEKSEPRTSRGECMNSRSDPDETLVRVGWPTRLRSS
jgi:hypothetical protein